jgi:fatty-acyl-CoA synthase
MYHFDWIKRHAERTPHKLALVDAHTDRRLTYAQFNERANRFASYLVNTYGLKPQERISILAQNSTDYFEVLFGCGKAGIILNTLNWRLAPPELEFIINDCQPRLLIYEPMFTEVVDDLRGKIPCEFYMQLGDGAPQGEVSYEDALQTGSPAGVELLPLTYEDTWAIIYTSGTTGKPKGAKVTFGNFFYNAVGMGLAIDLNSEDVNINVLPTFHIGGLGLYACPTIHAGGTVVVMRAFDPQEFMRLVQEWRVTKFLLVPSIYLVLAEHLDLGHYDLSSVKSWASGGSALPPSLVHLYAEKGIIIQQGFGMTETGPTVFLITWEDALRKAGSVGKPVMHTDVCIMDRQGNVLGADEVGELCIKGGNVTSGYWNRPDATAEALVDGWLHSGDAAKFDEEGFYYIVDRWKDMFISGGENVYPAEVENVIYQHPAVAEVAVIGVPHPKWQEVGRAIVVLKQGHALSEEEVIEFCQGKLARYKIPKSVAFTDQLPRTAAGKVLKRELRQQFSD